MATQISNHIRGVLKVFGGKVVLVTGASSGIGAFTRTGFF
jgi:NADP-dependent 3-hydroxy acid dehydrogenase YdfG